MGLRQLDDEPASGGRVQDKQGGASGPAESEASSYDDLAGDDRPGIVDSRRDRRIRKHRTTTTKSVVIAGTTVTLAPGATTVVKLSLNATGRKLRARAHRLTGELTITQTVVGQTSMLSTETVVFKAKSKAKR